MRVNRGPIELWLAGNDVIDMFECVSTCVCAVSVQLTLAKSIDLDLQAAFRIAEDERCASFHDDLVDGPAVTTTERIQRYASRFVLGKELPV